MKVYYSTITYANFLKYKDSILLHIVLEKYQVNLAK